MSEDIWQKEILEIVERAKKQWNGLYIDIDYALVKTVLHYQLRKGYKIKLLSMAADKLYSIFGLKNFQLFKKLLIFYFKNKYGRKFYFYAKQIKRSIKSTAYSFPEAVQILIKNIEFPIKISVDKLAYDLNLAENFLPHLLALDQRIGWINNDNTPISLLHHYTKNPKLLKIIHHKKRSAFRAYAQSINFIITKSIFDLYLDYFYVSNSISSDNILKISKKILLFPAAAIAFAPYQALNLLTLPIVFTKALIKSIYSTNKIIWGSLNEEGDNILHSMIKNFDSYSDISYLELIYRKIPKLIDQRNLSNKTPVDLPTSKQVQEWSTNKITMDPQKNKIFSRKKDSGGINENTATVLSIPNFLELSEADWELGGEGSSDPLAMNIIELINKGSVSTVYNYLLGYNQQKILSVLNKARIWLWIATTDLDASYAAKIWLALLNYIKEFSRQEDDKITELILKTYVQAAVQKNYPFTLSVFKSVAKLQDSQKNNILHLLIKAANSYPEICAAISMIIDDSSSSKVQHLICHRNKIGSTPLHYIGPRNNTIIDVIRAKTRGWRNCFFNQFNNFGHPASLINEVEIKEGKIKLYFNNVKFNYNVSHNHYLARVIDNKWTLAQALIANNNLTDLSDYLNLIGKPEWAKSVADSAKHYEYIIYESEDLDEFPINERIGISNSFLAKLIETSMIFNNINSIKLIASIFFTQKISKANLISYCKLLMDFYPKINDEFNSSNVELLTKELLAKTS